MSFLSRVKRKIFKLFHPEWGQVLMLHRVVVERSSLNSNKELEITPEFLEEKILYYQQRDYQFVSLDELYTIVSRSSRPKRKFICFTFDDGYIDNYELAYPIFKKYNCPFAIYITTDFPDQKALLWWYVLEDILLKNNEFKSGDGTIYDCSTLDKKNETFIAVREKIFSMQSDNMEQTLNKLFVNYSFSFKEKNQHYCLSWEQIQELANDDICTIASHTVTHAFLPNLSDRQIEIELILSKEMLEKQTGRVIEYFAYPYGGWNATVEKYAHDAGYKTAVLTNGGLIRKGSKLLNLKRNILQQSS